MLTIILILFITGTITAMQARELEEKNKIAAEKALEEEKYSKIFYTYADALQENIKSYMAANNNEIPDFKIIEQNMNTTTSKIVCDIREIYPDKTIYLDSCVVDNRPKKYSYGTKKNDISTGKIYIYQYTDEHENKIKTTTEEYNDPKYKLLNTYNCNNLTCTSYNTINNELITIKDGEINILYNYKTSEVKLKTDKNIENIFINNNDNNVYLSLYSTNDNYESDYSLYDATNNKYILESDYNYIYCSENECNNNRILVRNKNGVNQVRELSTGNIILEKNNLNILEESFTPYPSVCYTSLDNNKYSLYDKDGKEIIPNANFEKISFFDDGRLIGAIDKKFYIFNYNGDILYESKEHEKILGFTRTKPNYTIIVNNNNEINLIKTNDETKIASLGTWANDYDAISPFYYEEENVVSFYYYDKSVKSGTLGSVKNINYNLKTGEKKVTELNGYDKEKPILYLYPTTRTKINVTFKNPNVLTTTYPKYNNGWNVIANPNGDLYDENDKYYYGLYWEEKFVDKPNFKTGFYVTKENAIAFLEDKLSILGFNDKERNEFIMYWLPVLEKNEKSVVYFELTEEREKDNKLIITPTPNSLLRVMMHVKKVDKKSNIKEQYLPTFDRVGFVAVEWGGVNYNK